MAAWLRSAAGPPRGDSRRARGTAAWAVIAIVVFALVLAAFFLLHSRPGEGDAGGRRVRVATRAAHRRAPRGRAAGPRQDRRLVALRRSVGGRVGHRGLSRRGEARARRSLRRPRGRDAAGRRGARGVRRPRLRVRRAPPDELRARLRRRVDPGRARSAGVLGRVDSPVGSAGYGRLRRDPGRPRRALREGRGDHPQDQDLRREPARGRDRDPPARHPGGTHGRGEPRATHGVGRGLEVVGRRAAAPGLGRARGLRAHDDRPAQRGRSSPTAPRRCWAATRRTRTRSCAASSTGRCASPIGSTGR